MTSPRVSTLLIVCSLLGGVAPAQQAQNLPKVTIAGTFVRSLESEATGRQMDLYIHLPADYDRDLATKHPVLYILDGQWDFRLMDALLAGLDYDRYTPDMILVRVTWSGEGADYNALRTMDFLPPTAGQTDGFGGAPKFLKFLKSELIPFIESNYRADPARRILQGRSYGGLFTLYALFSDPGLFSGYMASSPAVDFGNNYVFRSCR